MGGSGAAAAPHHRGPGGQDALHGGGKLVGPHVEHRFPALVHPWQASVGLHHQRTPGVRGHLAQQLRQLGRAKRAVQPHGAGPYGA